MKVTQIGHASVLVETRGIAILSDPWWKGPCFGAQWWIYPQPFVEVLERTPPDYIYISHGHHDHLHVGTLRTLPRAAKVLVSSKLGIATSIRELGFEVIEIDPAEEHAIGEVRIRIVPTYGDDSLMAIDDGERVLLNINDALHSAPRDVQDHHVARLKSLYPKIDYALCGYGVASHFPNCYVIPGKDPAATAIHRQRYFNRQWARLMTELAPRYAFPFAADVVFLEESLFWANEPVHNGERPTAALRSEYPGTTIEAIDLAPGFVIEGDRVVDNVLRTPLDPARLRSEAADGIRRANAYGSTSHEAIADAQGALQGRVTRFQEELGSLDDDYRLLIFFHNSDRHLALVKRGTTTTVEAVDLPTEADYDIVYRTRLAYLKWALTEPYGDELLFVGSGGVFEYASQDLALRNVHRELIGLLQDRVPLRTARDGWRALYRRLRSRVARHLRPSRLDLYDLREWTVFSKN